MTLDELKSRTIGEIASEIGDVLSQEDYAVIEALSERTHQQILGVDHKLAVSALLMTLLNMLGHKAPALEALATA